ncbi:hypothetical protein Tsubulata_032946 [Turnera subulata]|uniref:Amino acid transporter transmembrane domain-containing protein n=1 Tax=Turnera subulata TaxID=218843 RepID=A0A9Q0FPU1_9ROSI|nr:hypothetical protein Tsubulata_032946 [Turnera subulata]
MGRHGKTPVRQPSKRGGPSSSSSKIPLDDQSVVWFTSRAQHTLYQSLFHTRQIFPPRYLPVSYPREKNYTRLEEQLRASGLWDFVTNRSHQYSADFTKAFYSTLNRDGDVLTAQVNGIAISLTLEQFGAVSGLPSQGEDIASYGGPHFITTTEAPLLQALGFTERNMEDDAQGLPLLSGFPSSNEAGDHPLKRTGVLSLAWSIAQLGWVAGPMCMLAFAAITIASTYLLSDCYRYPHPEYGLIRCRSYMDAVRLCLGERSRQVCGVFVLESLYGCGIAYVITSANSMR